ncbi:PAS domain S-box protein [Nodularia harveyana UHCC-0300]|uniref:histidine kinase n=1 Tax=Nodularia harveyana UHCC-0300 TaxID=2974287 RepID=A0ABU5UGM4_9CYAN|nr:PAS domain S-box protein [Nodularia harveyana]MEA5582655.1 PAS domain S-box protein [Nodularia harveyana UHCC-0300]
MSGYDQGKTDAVEAEVYLQQAIQYVPVEVAIFDLQIHYLWVSSRFLEEYHLSHEIIGRSHYEVFPHVTEHCRQIHQKCLTGAIEERHEDPYIKSDGTTQWVSWLVRPWYQPSGEIGGIIMYSENITQRKQTEIALRHSEERYKSLITASSQIVWTVPADGIPIYENTSWGEFTGQTPEESQGIGSLSAIHPGDRKFALATWKKAISTGTPCKMEYRLRKHDGEYRYMLARSVPVLETDSSVREWVGTCTDIHERKEALAALEKRNTLLQSILAGTPDLILAKDLHGRYVTINSNAANFLGKPIEEIIGKNDLELFAPEIADEIVAKDQQILSTGISETYEEDVPYNNVIRNCITTKVPWLDSNGKITGLIGIVRDVTDRKQAEIALNQAKEAAETASHAKSEFLANMSHELRTPLNGILGYAQILQRSPNLDSQQRSRIDIIYKCGSHLLTLINDILDLSKIEAQKVELMPTDFHFPAFLESVAEMCRIRAEIKHIEFHYHITAELPIGIRADEKRLRQVLINLLSNAIKFTDVGSVTFTVNYTSEGKIRFAVRDTGIGIVPEKLEVIFQPFEQAGDSRRQTEGTGLGLAISQKIVQFMDSTIQVESQSGVGSIFYFDVYLPAADEWIKTSQRNDYGQIIGIKNYQPKILVVDDKWENRSVIAHLLIPLGFQVMEAVDGDDAWLKIWEFHPDLIITDLLMPELDGFKLIQRIRNSEAFKNIVIIVSSASVFETEKQRSLEVGGDDFIPKPLQAIELLHKLEEYLHLEWLYKQQEDVNESDIKTHNLELVAPPTAEIAILYELAMKGNFRGITKQAASIAKMDEKYLPFAQKLQQMAREFQDQEILELIQSHQ